MALSIIILALFSAVPLAASGQAPTTETRCMLQVGPRAIDFGDVPIGTRFTDREGASLLALSLDPTATDSIAVNLTFAPSPPFFDGFNCTGSSGDGSFPPGAIDDHLIRCLPTQLGLVHGTITVSATNCPSISITLSCNGTEPEPTSPSPTPVRSATPCATPVCPESPLPPNCPNGPCLCFCEATVRPTPTVTPASTSASDSSGDCSLQGTRPRSEFPAVGALLLAFLAARTRIRLARICKDKVDLLVNRLTSRGSRRGPAARAAERER